MAWHLELTDPPTQEPIAVAVVRDEHLRAVNGSAEDNYIDRLIVVSRKFGEKVTRRAWTTRVFEATEDRFYYERSFTLPRPPLQSVASIEYLDTNGVLQTLDTADYIVSPRGKDANERGRVSLAYGKSWPSTRCQPDGIVVTFTAGYPDVGTPASPEVPEDLVHGMLLMIGEMYKIRTESVQAVNNSPAVLRARDLWMPYRIW